MSSGQHGNETRIDQSVQRDEPEPYDDTSQWQVVAYEGFEIHLCVSACVPHDAHGFDLAPDSAARFDIVEPARFTYRGYVCHPGANLRLAGHAVPFHPEGDVDFATAAAAQDEAWQVGRSIVDGTHPDLTVLPLVTGGV